MSNKDFDPFTGKIQESEGVENNSFFHRFWDNLKKNKITLVCLFLLGIIIFLSVFIFLCIPACLFLASVDCFDDFDNSSLSFLLLR